MKLNNKQGFTLIELLVVISIISMLASIILANINSARDRARLAANMQFEANLVHTIGDQMVGEWKFDDGAGVASDTSSFGNNATAVNATWSANGGYNGKGAYIFNGSNYITIGAPSILNFSGLSSFTESAWVNTPNGGGTIFGRHTAAGDTMATLRMGGGKLNVLLHTTNAPAGFYDFTSTGAVPLNKWVYVAVVYDGTNISFYMNGVLDSKFPASGSINAGYSGVVLGRNTAGGEFLTGTLDTARIYTSALTGMNIQNIYAMEKPNHPDSVALK